MRIYDNNTKDYIQNLAATIDKDPASLENWGCLHVTHQSDVPFEHVATTLATLKETHCEVDYDVVHCPDNDVFFISRAPHTMHLYEIAEQLIHEAFGAESGKAELVLFDLFRDWQVIRDLLVSKTGEAPAFMVPQKQFTLPENNLFEEAFAEAKKLRASREPLHVMLVEDDPITRRIVTNSFRDDFALITAGDAEEAIANYLLHAPDIVFLDIGLPDVSGFEVLHQIMQRDPDAYVVMFSASGYLDNISASLAAGAAGFVAKPFRREKLLHYIYDSALHHHKDAA